MLAFSMKFVNFADIKMQVPMQNKILPLLLMLLLLPCAASAAVDDDINRQIETERAALRKNPSDMTALRTLGILYLNKADFDSAILVGKKLQDLAYNVKDYGNNVVYSHFILGEAYTMKGHKKLAYDNLMQALNNAVEVKNDTALSSVYNGLGIYATYMQNDYYQSLTCFFKGLEAAKRSKNTKLYNILLSNISETYCMKRDTTGLKYALECYSIAKKNSNSVLLFYSAVSAASLYLLKNDLGKAEAYVNEAARVAVENKFKGYAEVHNIKGTIALRRGNPQLAATLFKRSVDDAAANSVTNTVHGYLGYGQSLAAMHRYDEAVKAYSGGITLSREKNQANVMDGLLLSMSQSYELMGDARKALQYYKQYHECADSLYNADKERAMGDIRAKYDIEKKENQLKQSQLDLLQAKNRLYAILGVLGLLVVTATLLYILYRRKNALYKAIVKQNQEAIRREQALQQRLDGQHNSDKRATSSLTDKRKQTLYNQLEELMADKKIYHDKLITKEKVADMLGSNRTYLSQIINEQTGLTFTAYIGSLRIKEAVELLSDPANDTPLKAVCGDVGFSSMTTFYNQFRQTTGMTPASYRMKVVEMAAE